VVEEQPISNKFDAAGEVPGTDGIVMENIYISYRTNYATEPDL